MYLPAAQLFHSNFLGEREKLCGGKKPPGPCWVSPYLPEPFVFYFLYKHLELNIRALGHKTFSNLEFIHISP